MKYIIGVDLGGTNVKVALVDLKGKIIKKYETPTQVKRGSRAVINNIISAIEKVKTGKVIGIGIGSPGPLDFRTGVITTPVNLPFRHTPLRKIIRDKFRIKTYLDNDANCFALAEAIFGQGKRYENVIGITLGTGLGGGLVINKKLYHGRNNAAELGHLTIKYDGPKTRCGNDGCIETHVAARGITAIHGGSEPYMINMQAFKGDKKALKTYRTMGYYLGIGITNFIYAFDPDIIIIGGKISNAWNFFSKTMNQVIKKRYFTKPCRIVKSKLKEAGILGAAALALENK